MNAVAESALAHWGLSGAQIRLVAARENSVFEVTRGTDRYALRLHRQGYRTDAELHAELAWMAAIADGGLSVPAPIRSGDGAYLKIVEGVQVDILSWLDGQTMRAALEDLPEAARLQMFHTFGQDLARFHDICDAWTPPEGFTRVHWNLDGLVGPAPLWDRFWENPALSAGDRALFTEFRAVATDRLADLHPTLDYGLIHADLVPENVLVDGAVLRFIDFDDGGYGYRRFDIATALLKHEGAADYEALKRSLLAGYGAVRPCGIEALDLFIALRAATYVGWNIRRMKEPGGVERNARFIARLRTHARAVLERAV